MIRTLLADPFNRIANHPEVRPWLGMSGRELDLTALVSNPENVCLLTDTQKGGYILQKIAVGCFYAHSLAEPDGRGKPMLKLMRDGFAYLFLETDAVEVVSCVPDGNDNARSWAHLAGFRTVFRREECFALIDELVGADFVSLAFVDWALADHRCHDAGRRFHALMDRHGELNHTYDPAQTCMIGAALLLAQNGNLTKAVSLYNRWALHAGYRPVTALSQTPPIIDMGSVTVGLSNGEVCVLNAPRYPREPAKGEAAHL